MADSGGSSNSNSNSNSKSNSTNFGDVIKANFGGYLIAAVAVIVTYSVVDAIYPQYSTPLALVTLLGIALFYMNRSKSS